MDGGTQEQGPNRTRIAEGCLLSGMEIKIRRKDEKVKKSLSLNSNYILQCRYVSDGKKQKRG